MKHGHGSRRRPQDSVAISGLDGLLDTLSRCFDAESARRVAEFRISAHVQGRIDVLAERANEGLLSEEERGEYETLVNTADFISILKVKAQRGKPICGNLKRPK